MESRLFKKVLDEASGYGLEYVDLCMMGDSLLDPEFEEKMDYLRKNYPGVKAYASSQGMSAKPDLVCKYIDTLHISFYGTDKTTYESVHRGGGKYEVALENVEAILSRPRNERPYVIMTFLVLPQNESQLKKWISKWEPLADEVIVWRPHNWAGVYGRNPGLTENDYKNATSCGRPFNGPLAVWVNGDVTVCCFSWDKSLVIGNAYEQSLEEIINGEKRKEVIQIHSQNAFYKCGLQCAMCDQIFSREAALVYTNKGRKTGEQIYSDTKTVGLSGIDTKEN